MNTSLLRGLEKTEEQSYKHFASNEAVKLLLTISKPL